MKALIASLASAVLFAPSTGLATDIACKRIGSKSGRFLKNVAAATIVPREFNFDARIRFLDKAGQQVETCSTEPGVNRFFRCWNFGQTEGQTDNLAMILEVSSSGSETNLARIAGEFLLTAISPDEAFRAHFYCGRLSLTP